MPQLASCSHLSDSTPYIDLLSSSTPASRAEVVFLSSARGNTIELDEFASGEDSLVEVD